MKTAYVKNPLTVIAIFAGLTEVGGTTVLPFLTDPGNQRVYILFLIVFPIMLVHLFFRVLWYKHTNFYAPSDFESDETFVKAQAAGLNRKWDLEVEEAAALPTESSSPDMTPATESVSTESDAIPLPNPTAVRPEADLKPEQDAPSEEAVGEEKQIFLKNARRNLELRKRVFAAQDWALRKLAEEEGGVYVRDVSPTGLRQVIFDAVKADSSLLEVVEVKYNRSGHISRDSYAAPVDAALRYYSILDEELRKRFRFSYIVVFDKVPQKLRKQFMDRLEHYCLGLPFPVIFRMYDFDQIAGDSSFQDAPQPR